MKKIEKTEKRLKKEKSMYNNMHTHLKSKGISCEMVEIKPIVSKKETKPNKEETKPDKKEIITPSYFIQGSKKTNKEFIFQLKIHEDKHNDNGNPQVQLLLQTNKNEYTTLEPQTNGQLTFMIENFQTGLTTIQPEKLEEKK